MTSTSVTEGVASPKTRPTSPARPYSRAVAVSRTRTRSPNRIGPSLFIDPPNGRPVDPRRPKAARCIGVSDGSPCLSVLLPGNVERLTTVLMMHLQGWFCLRDREE